MRGTTALISIVDPGKANLWVASLGDSAAGIYSIISYSNFHFELIALYEVLGTKDPQTGQWSAQVLSAAHNGENPVEAERVRSEHPDEPEAILDDRVLGGIAVTKGI